MQPGRQDWQPETPAEIFIDRVQMVQRQHFETMRRMDEEQRQTASWLCPVMMALFASAGFAIMSYNRALWPALLVMVGGFVAFAVLWLWTFRRPGQRQIR